jgi:hypothetical protein
LLSYSPVCNENHLIITPFVVQSGKTVLMLAAEMLGFAAPGSARIETMQLLLKSGAAASINDKDEVAHLSSHLAV